jgi:hypothetical protein
MKYFAGLDWGSTTHAVCVVNRTGCVVLRTEIRHDASGLESLQRQLKRIAPAKAIPIAIERPSGLIVDALLASGHPIVPIHPNAVKACRPRYSAAGGKNDLGDACLLADVLRTDGHRFRPLAPPSDAIKALRALVRTRDDLVNGCCRAVLSDRLAHRVGFPPTLPNAQ